MNFLYVEYSASFWRKFFQPFFLLLFFYFFLVSAELLNLPLVIFKFRINLLIGLIASGVFFISLRVLRIDRDFLAVTIGCVSSMLISAIFGYFWVACFFYIFLFVFNYLIFFVFPCNLFRTFDPNWIMEFYFISFISVGFIALAQVFFSMFGIVLPGAGQVISSLSRGQGFSYEPSFYALYMTPFAMFQTVKFFLQDKNERSYWKLFGANFLLLISTSTGCFFSYLALLICLVWMKLIRIIRNISVMKIIWRVFFVFTLVGAVLWIVSPSLLSSGFLKLFWNGIIYHHTFQARWRAIESYWEIFLDHPILGTGLGGASSYFAEKNGIVVAANDPMILETNMAMNVTTEILGSLGIVGMFAFGCFFWTLWKNCRRTLNIQLLTPDERINVLAFIVSMFVMFFALQFSQSIMRPYIWLHVGISMGYMKYLQTKYLSASCV